MNELEAPDIRQINYGQAYSGSVLYMGLTRLLRSDEGWKLTPCIITSNKQCIENPENTSATFGFRLRKPPVTDEQRWSESSLQRYLRGDEFCSLLDTFINVQGLIGTYCHFEDDRWIDVVALFILLSYVHQIYPAFPYFQVNGYRESGKTTLLEIIAALSFNGILTSSVSPAFIFRYVDSFQATICIDEFEGLDGKRNENDEMMQRLLNSGYKQSSTVSRAAVGKRDGEWKPETFRAYSPKCFAGIAELPPTLASRCISITMLKSSDPSFSRIEFRPDTQIVQDIRDDLYVASMLNASNLLQSYDEITDPTLCNRTLQLWRPILSTANLIDQDLGKRIMEFSNELEAEKESLFSDRTVVSLLAAINTYLGKSIQSVQFVPLFTLKEILIQSDEELFGFLRAGNDGVGSSRWITRQLRQAGVVKAAASNSKLGGGGNSVRGHWLNGSLVLERLKAYAGTVTFVTSVSEIKQMKLLVTEDTKVTMMGGSDADA